MTLPALILGCFKRLWTDTAQMTVSPLPVVDYFEVIEDTFLRVAAGFIASRAAQYAIMVKVKD